MKTPIRKISPLCVGIASVHIYYADVQAQTKPTLEVRAAQDTVVALEPVKLICTLRNNTGMTLQIMDVQQYGANMEYMYYILSPPSGGTEYRNFRNNYQTGFFNSEYTGETLLPNRSVEFFLYPAYTRLIDPISLERFSGGRTFAEIGTYSIRIAHFIPPQLERLWAGRSSDRTIVSEATTLVVVEPTAEDRAVLETLWRGHGGEWLSEGDDGLGRRTDEEELRATLKRYPRARMSRYVYLALARSLSTPSSFNRTKELERAAEAAQYLEVLVDLYRGFRTEEVLQCLGKNYTYLGKPVEGREAFDRAMRSNPNLATHYGFMWTRLSSLYPRDKLVNRWLESRSRAEPFIESQ